MSREQYPNSKKWRVVACPKCNALVGEPCINGLGGKAKNVHRARMTAYSRSKS